MSVWLCCVPMCMFGVSFLFKTCSVLCCFLCACVCVLSVLLCVLCVCLVRVSLLVVDLGCRGCSSPVKRLDSFVMGSMFLLLCVVYAFCAVVLCVFSDRL